MKVTIHPPLSTNPREADEELSGELASFNSWFMARQASQGSLDPTPLTSFERGAIKAYLIYACSDRATDSE